MLAGSFCDSRRVAPVSGLSLSTVEVWVAIQGSTPTGPLSSLTTVGSQDPWPPSLSTMKTRGPTVHSKVMGPKLGTWGSVGTPEDKLQGAQEVGTGPQGLPGP